ncbi:MAG: vitamin K epoxide reductase family protein [Patescibacteria group bacterium]|nr:vitamin K epoxide reductase family protein [Patescibacteria group bacterium]MDE1966190.1 vitamin K epoxide reductase family protein [Patescibacteria group bacterium]
MKRAAVWLILLLTFVGIADAAYLAESETTGTPLVCNIQGLTGCNVVAQSEYSRLFGIPVADYGVAFYAVLFALAALEVALVAVAIRRTIQALALVGVLTSAVFVYVQLALIHAICIYCMASAFISLLIFICSLPLEHWPSKKRADALPIRLGDA